MAKGWITPKGYRRMYSKKHGRQVFEHRLVWEAVHGPVPPGMQIHHKNEDKLDNRIENLELLTPLEHGHEHSGCKLIDGTWVKSCRVCRETKPVTDFYKKEGMEWVDFECKSCRRARSARNRRAANERKAALRQGSSEPSSD